VTHIDPVAIRLDCLWQQIEISRYPECGARVIPWSRVDDIQIVTPATTEAAT
jgi:hypothetical protein